MTSTTMNDLRDGKKVSPQPNSYDGLKRQLEGSKGEFLPLLGSAANVDAFLRVVLNAVLANPDLATANRRSLIAACMKAAVDGLLPDGREAVLNVYNTKMKDRESGRESWVPVAQYLPMVGGMIKSLYESGQVSMVDAAAVYEKDRFLFRRGDQPVLEHEPTYEDDPGRVIAAYVVVRMTSGEMKREVMFRRDIEAVRAVSKTGDSGTSPWAKWYDQQAIKSVIKRAAKQLPRMDRLERQITHDNEALGIVAQQGIGDMVAPPPAGGGIESLAFDPSPTLHDITGGERVEDREKDQVRTGAGAKTSRARGKQSAAEDATVKTDGPGAGPDAEAPAAVHAQLIEAMNAAPDRDVADQVLDRGRALPDVQREELARLYETRFPD